MSKESMSPIVEVDCEIYGIWVAQEPSMTKQLKLNQRHTRTKRNVERTDVVAATEELWLERIIDIRPPEGITSGHKTPDVNDKVAVWDLLDEVHWLRKKIHGALEEADEAEEEKAREELKNLRRSASGGHKNKGKE